MVASRYRLDNLIAIVDHNKLQQFGWRGDSATDRLPPEVPGELVAKFSAFGWRVIDIDGHDMRHVVTALEDACRPEGRPVMIIANTIKGKGVSFMEGQYAWHIGVPTDEQLAQALDELGQTEPAAGAR
jgi:transketolase